MMKRRTRFESEEPWAWMMMDGEHVCKPFKIRFGERERFLGEEGRGE
jgi:hypothetical protein